MVVPSTLRAMTTGILEIPINGADEIIELEIANLPEAHEVMDMMRREAATLATWSNVALEYYRIGREQDYLQIMEAAKSEARRHCRDSDKMVVLDSLAAYYAKLGTAERDKERRQHLFVKATMYYAAADKVVMYDLNHLLGRANFCLLEGEKLEQADSQFNFIIANTITSIPALLGKACIAYTKKDYRAALAFFRKALRTNPSTTAEVRMGLGMCLLKLGQPGKARLAFVRALELNPKCVPALIGMAVYYLNEATLETVKRGVQLLSKAYVFDPNNPMVLNHLANHFFFKGQLDKAYQLAIHAFRGTVHEGLRAESCFQLARVFHFRREYDKAFQYYYQATQFAGSSSGYVLPQFGLGQLYIHRNDFENAALCFERVLKAEPENYESMKILGSLYANAHAAAAGSDSGDAKRDKARGYLRKVTAKQPDDVEAWTELAQLLEPVDVQESLRCYMTVIRLHVGEAAQAPVPVPADILNNVGALHYRLGNHAEARDYFEETLERARAELCVNSSISAKDEGAGEDNASGQIEGGSGDQAASTAAAVAFGSISVTASYNLARLEEACCNFGKAEVIYKDILRQHPNYVDCYLRLGCIAREKGNIYEASDWFKEALQLSNEHPDAWTLIGNLHLSKAEWQPAQKKFERILANPATAHDSYALIALANIWLHMLPMCSTAGRGRDEAQAKERRHQERAVNIFKQVLRNDPKNIWAANGIGAVMAHKGFWNEARDVFAQVREATADFQDVWLNIAHVYVEQRQFMAAVLMYENCIKKFYKHHPADILQFLARAQLKHGKLREAKMALLRARRVAPFDAVLLYNLAFILQRIAVQALRDDKSNLAAVLEAVRDLTQAHKYFQFLAGGGTGTGCAPSLGAEGTKPKYDVASAMAETRQCQDLLSQASYHVARARKADQDERLQRKRQEEEREAARLAQQVEARRREEEKKKREEELLRKREEFKEQRKSALQFLETQPPESKAGRKRGKKTAGAGGGGGESDADANAATADMEEGADRSRNRRGRPRKSGAGGRRRRGRRPRREDPDRKGRIVSRELISTSESSSEAEGEGRNGDGDSGNEEADVETPATVEPRVEDVDDLPDPNFSSSDDERAEGRKLGFRGFEDKDKEKFAAALAEEVDVVGRGRRKRMAYIILSNSESEDSGEVDEAKAPEEEEQEPMQN